MAITNPIWRVGWGLLTEYFKQAKPFSAELTAIYLEQLSAELTDDAFTLAVKWTIREKATAYGYFPSVADLLAAARGPSATGDPTLDDAVAGKVICATLRETPVHDVQTGYYISRPKVEAVFGAAALTAFDGVGGSRRILSTPDNLLGIVFKEFGELYAAARQAERTGGAYARLAGTADERRRIPGQRAGTLTPVGASPVLAAHAPDPKRLAAPGSTYGRDEGVA